MYSAIQVLKHIFILSIKVILGLVAGLILLGYCYTFYKEYVHDLTTPENVHKISTSDGDITYLSYGDTKSQPIVFFHGTGANAFIWEKTSTFLASNGYYVIAVDLPPFGWSSIPSDPGDYRKETQAKKIIELLTVLSIANPIIVGHSYNSKVALLVASSIPSKELILVAPVLEYGEKPDPGMIGKLTSISLIRDPLLSLFVNNTLLAKKVLQSFMYKKDVDVSSVLAKTVLPFNKQGVNHAYGEWFQEFFDETSTVSDSVTLKNLTIPVYVLWGDKDTISPIENFKKLHDLSPNAILTTLPEVGHMPHLENSVLFNSRLIEVLAE